MSESFDLPDVEHLAAGAIGPPGQRVFYLQARHAGRLVSFKVEKAQVGALASVLADLLADLPAVGPLPDTMDLEEPVVLEWVVGSLGVSYDEPTDRVLIVVEELVPEDAEGAVARLSATRPQVAVLAKHGASLVEAGRPPCPLCANPLDPRGHVCPRHNGHGPPTP